MFLKPVNEFGAAYATAASSRIKVSCGGLALKGQRSGFRQGADFWTIPGHKKGASGPCVR